MPTRKVVLCVTLLLSSLTVVARGQGPSTALPGTLPPPMVYRAMYATVPPMIDGVIGKREWRDAAWTTAFVDIEGSRKPLPRFQTRAKIMWDDRCLYLAAFLQEPHVIGTLRQRDTVIFYDNDFELFMDPNGDCLAYMEFEMNALNTVWDLLLPKAYRAKGDADDSWNMDGLRTATHVYGTINNPSDVDSGWSAEIAIPWTALRRGGVVGAPLPGEQWKLNFSRVEWRYDITDGKYVKRNGPEDNWVWSPQGVVDMHRPEFWGEVVFAKAKGPAPAPDPAWPAYVYLSAVWYAQNDFNGAHGRYATSLEELKLAPGGFDPQFSVRDSGFTVTATLHKGKRTYFISVDERSAMHRQVR